MGTHLGAVGVVWLMIWVFGAVGSLGIMVLGGVGIGGSQYFQKAGILHPEA